MKKKNKKNRVRKTKNNIFFRMTAIISTIIFVIFGIMLYMLDMIPFKYLIIFYYLHLYLKILKIKLELVHLYFYYYLVLYLDLVLSI